ncbi:MAG: hypothetical protein EU539_01205 [Promethearchaeota archaeon]|nr:MAG: hypothetical protein EU539_01205 [Candidatus Lokiarchaeota archaeon]
MILKNANIYSEGMLRKGSILINDGLIISIIYNHNQKEYLNLINNNKDKMEIDCQERIIIPGIIDIHSHLRDMEQQAKETFETGTRAAACSGITTILNMPNTIPPAISSEQVQKWMDKARENINVDVGFIAGFPKKFDEEEVKKIIDKGVFGFKIYPASPINGIDWMNVENITKLFHISSKKQIMVFIHADWPFNDSKREEIYKNFDFRQKNILKLHERLDPPENELKYVKFILNSYKNYIKDKNLRQCDYPIIHFCHISCKDSFSAINKVLNKNKNFNITFEVTPHHLLLSNDILLENANFGKVLPPLRGQGHVKYLFKKLKKGEIDYIGTDHAPHTIEEKSQDYLQAPSGFPGFETYPLLLLDLVCNFDVSLERFVKVACENPAKKLNLNNKGYIKEGFQADILIAERVPRYSIDPTQFKSKAKYSPFKNFKTALKIWKVFLRGIEINNDDVKPIGKIISLIKK